MSKKIKPPKKNRYGLKRPIPADVRLAVRQQCFFCCVICGQFPVEYDHFDPEWINAQRHEAAGIALLCKKHHGERTAGLLATDHVRAARLAPHGATHNAVWFHTLGPSFAGLRIGNNTIGGADGGGLVINDHPVLQVTRAANGQVHISGSFVDHAGRAILRMEENAIAVHSGSWDASLDGQTLVVRSGHGKVDARLRFDANEGVVELQKLSMSVGPSASLLVDSNGLRFVVAGGMNVELSGSAVAGGRISFNDARLGKYEDWVKFK